MVAEEMGEDARNLPSWFLVEVVRDLPRLAQRVAVKSGCSWRLVIGLNLDESTIGKIGNRKSAENEQGTQTKRTA